jgi:hypothetical protein
VCIPRKAIAEFFSSTYASSHHPQLADFLLGQRVPGDRRAISLAVHVEDMGFGDQGAIALCDMLTKVHSQTTAASPCVSNRRTLQKLAGFPQTKAHKTTARLVLSREVVVVATPPTSVID